MMIIFGRLGKFCLVMAVSFMLVASLAYANDAQGSFFQSLEDIPLMPGLTELYDQTLVFDKPEGRIVEAVAIYDSVSRNDIRTFYIQSLPQFGWQRLGDFTFVRRDEHLKFSFEEKNGQDFIHVMLVPVPVSAN